MYPYLYINVDTWLVYAKGTVNGSVLERYTNMYAVTCIEPNTRTLGGNLGTISRLDACTKKFSDLQRKLATG